MGSVVIGLGYGDEGKGLTTSFLCANVPNPLVVRFNGGHQAGHTVVHKGKRHVFSGFGSGTLQNVPTYWSQYCTFYPSSFLKEYDLLKDCNPEIYVHPLCPVTTPFDVAYNRSKELSIPHGSVGLGFGATIQRQEDYYKLFVKDLQYEAVLRAKLSNIARYYNETRLLTVSPERIEGFISEAKEALEVIKIVDDLPGFYDPVYEGAQGILLDMDHGFFPNVTRSNTTSKNALGLPFGANQVFYVTRSYATRHGLGFLHGEEKLNLVNNENETNKKDKYQGEFRTAKLNPDMMNYALECDHIYSRHLKKNLVITCMDQYPIDVDALLKDLIFDFNHVYLSHGPSLTDIKLYK